MNNRSPGSVRSQCSLSKWKHMGVALCVAAGFCVAARLMVASPLAGSEGGVFAELFNGGTDKATVLLFVSCECPISNRYAPELRRLHEKFSGQGVRFRLVYADRGDTSEAIHSHTNQYDLAMGFLRDPQYELVKRSKATVTPEAAVFRRDGQLVYHGRIDNRYVAFGKERPQATEHDLENVLEKVVAGERPRISYKKAVGCYLSD